MVVATGFSVSGKFRPGSHHLQVSWLAWMWSCSVVLPIRSSSK